MFLHEYQQQHFLSAMSALRIQDEGDGGGEEVWKQQHCKLVTLCSE